MSDSNNLNWAEEVDRDIERGKIALRRIRGDARARDMAQRFKALNKPGADKDMLAGAKHDLYTSIVKVPGIDAEARKMVLDNIEGEDANTLGMEWVMKLLTDPEFNLQGTKNRSAEFRFKSVDESTKIPGLVDVTTKGAMPDAKVPDAEDPLMRPFVFQKAKQVLGDYKGKRFASAQSASSGGTGSKFRVPAPKTRAPSPGALPGPSHRPVPEHRKEVERERHLMAQRSAEYEYFVEEAEWLPEEGPDFDYETDSD